MTGLSVIFLRVVKESLSLRLCSHCGLEAHGMCAVLCALVFPWTDVAGLAWIT